MAEWSNALVLKTRGLQGLQGSNPCASAIKNLIMSATTDWEANVIVASSYNAVVQWSLRNSS